MQTKLRKVKESEYQHYSGCGLRLIFFNEDETEIQRMVDPVDLVPWHCDLDKLTAETFLKSLNIVSDEEKLGRKAHTGFCSCYEINGLTPFDSVEFHNFIEDIMMEEI